MVYTEVYKMNNMVTSSAVCFICFITSVYWVNALDVTVGLTPNDGVPNYIQVSNVDALPQLQNISKAMKASGGGTLTFLPGTYILGRFFEISSDITLLGSGMDSTILKLMDYAPPFRVGTKSRSGLIRATITGNPHCKNIKVLSMTLDGNKHNQNTDADSLYGRYGLFTEACDDIVFDSVRVQNFQGYGFDPHGFKDTGAYGINLYIYNCIANDNDWDGFTLDQSKNIVVENCTSYSNGRHGFNIVTGSVDVSLTNIATNSNGYNYYNTSVGCGVMIQNNLKLGTHNVSVKNVVLTNDSRASVCTNDVFDISITQATLSTSNSCFSVTNTSMSISDVSCNSSKKSFLTQSGINDISETNISVSWAGADPSCNTGILFKTYCCDIQCGTCGGVNCSLRAGGSGCCTSRITQCCSSNLPPCVTTC